MFENLWFNLFRRKPRGHFVGRSKTRDVAITYRMGAGFAGDVNRMHPASIEPALVCAATPPTLFGQAVLVDPTTQGVRPLTTADSAITDIYGITVRPFPFQGGGNTNAYATQGYGGEAPNYPGSIDVLRSGYMMVKAVGTTVKGNPVYVWIAAASGNHVVGGFEAVSGGASTVKLPNATWNGGPDVNGLAEIVFRP